MIHVIFIVFFIASSFFSPAIALFTGILFTFLIKNPYYTYSKKISKYLLQIAVVGLGFGMNLHTSLEAGREGMVFTIISVAITMVLGVVIGKYLKIPSKLSYLIASGTAICGGSAIAAISPIIGADDNETSMSLAVIFILNAIALFIFPVIGHFFSLTEEQFGLWVAIAIHDTSSVVGAGAAYGPQALTIATTVKLMRALWIIPLSVLSMFIFKRGDNKKIYIPWFIFFFVLAMILNTYFQIPDVLIHIISFTSHKFLSMTLFLIGTSLSINNIKAVGFKPVLLGIILWIIISVTTWIAI